MPSYYLGTIKYQQLSTDIESVVTKTETRLIDAVSHTEAEARLCRVIAEDNIPDFEVTAIRPLRLSDVFTHPTGENWYKCQTFYMTESDKGKQKKVSNTMLINADSVSQASERLNAELSTMLVPVEVTAISLTPVIEVILYVSE